MSVSLNISILGASGFVGAELIKLCLSHPHININSMSANSQAGQKIILDTSVKLDDKYKSSLTYKFFAKPLKDY